MKISNYEIILPLIGSDEKEIEGKMLLVNGLYGSLDVVDKETAENIRDGKISDIPLAERERLALRGHITRKTVEEELADAQLLGLIHRKIVGYSAIAPVILPTYDCNFRCPYCFERHRLTRGQEWLGCEMKPEMVEAVFSALKKSKEKGQRVEHISLYGGEPFLAENISTVRNICEHAKEMGLSISAVTNGYDLENYIGLLEEFKIRNLQITVDGVGEMNDKRRRHRDGHPTYEKILQNTRLALEHGVDINLRVNVNRQNINEIPKLIKDLDERGLNEFASKEGDKKSEEKKTGRFSYYFKAVTEPKTSPNFVKEQEVLEKILETVKSPSEAVKLQSQYSGPAKALTDLIKKENYPSSSTAFCGAEQGMVIIAPDGKIFSCWDLVAMDDQVVGFTDIDAGKFFFGFEKAKWRTRTSDLLEKCKTCPHIFICRGGCASMAFIENGDYFREGCTEHKEIFAYIAPRIAGKNFEENHEKELSISLYGPLSRLTEDERKTIMTSKSQKEIFNILQEAGIFISRKY